MAGELKRRDFLKGTAWMGAVALAAGCRMDQLGFGAGGSMQDFALPPMKRVRVGFVGIGGHGGMDFIMDLRWAYCLQNGIPLDMDVYDLAASSCICELTETSVRNRSKAMDIPDFTRGAWRTTKPQGILSCDLSKIKLDRAAKDEAALNV